MQTPTSGERDRDLEEGVTETLHPRARHAVRDLAIVVAVALVLRVMVALLVADTYDFDEFVLLLYGRDMAAGSLPYHDFMFFHPPGELVLLQVMSPILHVWWPFARVLTMAIDCGTAAVVWALARRTFTPRTALLAALVYAGNPLAVIASVRVGQDPLVAFLGMAGMLALLARREWWGPIVAGTFLGVALWVKAPALLFIPAYLIASPRRGALAIVVAGAAVGLLLAPFLADAHAIYFDLVTFQRTRWHMVPTQRLLTILIFWLGVSPAALPGLLYGKVPLWTRLGFLTAGIFFLSPQVYYHYFVPVLPFAALLSGVFLERFHTVSSRHIVALSVAVSVASGVLIARGGPSPLYISAPRLSVAGRTANVLEFRTRSGSPVLADQYEYAYLAGRPALDHYFWNVGVLVDALDLERDVNRAGAVVMSYGASSGYPTGFVRYLNGRYPHVRTEGNTVWWIHPVRR